MHPIDIVFVGLAFDVAGAVILAKGFIVKTWDEARLESLSLYGANSHYIRGALLQRAEAITGALLLVVGYFLQMGANLTGAVEASTLGWANSVARLGLICLATWAVSWCCWRLAIRLEDVAAYRRMCSHPYQPIQWVPEGEQHQIARNLHFLRMRRKRGETDEQARLRIEQYRSRLWAKYGTDGINTGGNP
jgi:hypothetical protein